jgi:hypothetical protein
MSFNAAGSSKNTSSVNRPVLQQLWVVYLLLLLLLLLLH